MGLIGSSISIDGTKVKANTSPRQSKSLDALEKEIDKILKESIETDNYCSLCVLKNACTDSKNRTISRDTREYLMENMRAKLNPEEGTK